MHVTRNSTTAFVFFLMLARARGKKEVAPPPTRRLALWQFHPRFSLSMVSTTLIVAFYVPGSASEGNSKAAMRGGKIPMIQSLEEKKGADFNAMRSHHHASNQLKKSQHSFSFLLFAINMARSIKYALLALLGLVATRGAAAARKY